jgi:hypothetical protein
MHVQVLFSPLHDLRQVQRRQLVEIAGAVEPVARLAESVRRCWRRVLIKVPVMSILDCMDCRISLIVSITLSTLPAQPVVARADPQSRCGHFPA